MLDYDIQRCSRRCSATDRELKSGEICYSVLVSEGAAVVRRDYSQEAWSGPPDGAIGWWKATLLPENAGRFQWAPNDVMLHYFERLLEDHANPDTQYVLALLLVRRKILRLERREQDGAGPAVMILYCGRNEKEYRVIELSPTAERVAQIQADLTNLLKTPTEPTPDP